MTAITLLNASAARGAAMGRPNDHNHDATDKPVPFEVIELAWVDGDYDSGGTYWGFVSGEHIYRVTSAEFEITLWIRAKSIADVQAQVIATYPQATFTVLEPEDMPEAEEDTETFWFSTGSGRIELQLTMDQAESVSHSGQCDDDVHELRKVPSIAKQLAAIKPETLRAELREYGAWNANELADHDTNIDRILWLAGCDIRENREQYDEEESQS